MFLLPLRRLTSFSFFEVSLSLLSLFPFLHLTADKPRLEDFSSLTPSCIAGCSSAFSQSTSILKFLFIISPTYNNTNCKNSTINYKVPQHSLLKAQINSQVKLETITQKPLNTQQKQQLK